MASYTYNSILGWKLRVLILLLLLITYFFVLFNACGSQKTDETQKNGKRKPFKLHESLLKKELENQTKEKPIIGQWSVWSTWSPCSRSCGGGITQQTRHCINRIADTRFFKRQRRRRQNFESGCIGVYKRVHICNTQDCPIQQNFRFEQCAAFNIRPFKGKLYHWEPYYQAQTECILNCRPMGQNFYATLNKTVIDGTPCHHPLTATGRAAPKGIKGVCVDGTCKSVNSQGVVGGTTDNKQDDLCSACLKGVCRSVNGIYTRPDLPSGYSVVTQLPRGACGVLVQQLKHTRNFLALRFTNGTYLFNGDYKFSLSRTYHLDGTKVQYVKQDGSSLETISSPGPLPESLDIMVISYQANPGIKYGYSTPIENTPMIAPPLIKRPNDQPPVEESLHDVVHPRAIPLSAPSSRRIDSDIGTVNFNPYASQRDDPKISVLHRRPRFRRKHFLWKVTDIGPCSKTCDGGVQNYIYHCYRQYQSSSSNYPSHSVRVDNKKCAHLEQPVLQPIQCRTPSCPSIAIPTTKVKWDGAWGQCSVSCGEGVQNFITQCKSEVNGTWIVVTDEQCQGPKPLGQSRVCEEKVCDFFKSAAETNELPQVPPAIRPLRHEWTVSPWSTCSSTCGAGHKSRSVICPSGQCHPEDRPEHIEHCNLGPCEVKTLTGQSQTHQRSNWLVSEWSHCSEDCGTGNQTRLAICEQPSCSSDSKPETTRSCSSEMNCAGKWFAGPWSECSDSCNGPAKQTREVYCIAKIRGVPHITNDMTCPIALKPVDEQACRGSCRPQWFTGEWSECDCSSSHQIRDVKCFDQEQRYSSDCVKEDVPASRTQCACPLETKNHHYRDIHGTHGGHKTHGGIVQDEPVDRFCKDKISKCRLAVQARLCHYPYYTKNCCESCKRAQQGFFD